MGLSITTSDFKETEFHSDHHRTHKIFLFTNYILLGAASSCVFLTLSLRLIPSLYGGLFILLHVLTIASAAFSCTSIVASADSNKWYGVHMVATVLTAIFQGSASVLIFTRTLDLLENFNSYVRVEDGATILKFAGGLCILIFCLEWVVLLLAFVLRYNAFVEGNGGVVEVSSKFNSNSKVEDEDLKHWPCPFQV
ncbi:uncharacterized protein LOC107829338 [Nicotiana tabacum]|uniref:Uncharacterized protein LOC107829338 n=1 Tax=Nicotiana tabacum TaxID=4097 RepID=A0A1S4DFQ9_TOBAC|nr:PREDICTED: uncharacterized protein LOC107829338 [Nicotiana tabacum]